MSLENRLHEMTGKKYLYMNEEHLVKEVKIVDKTMLIITDQKQIVVPISEKAEFFENFIDMSDSSTAVVNHEEEGTEKILKTYKSTTFGIKSVLLDALDKLAEDPNYIKQAQAINQTTKVLLDVFKTELQIAKSIKK